MTKAELRKAYKQKRQELSEDSIEEKSIAIANQVLTLNIWHRVYFHLYLNIKSQKEINTEMIMHVLQGKDKQIVVSKSHLENFTLNHFLLTDSTKFKENRLGIPEPESGIEVPIKKIDVVFVPLLAFDEKGHRIGYGKGFYDRFLSQCRKDTLKIGLSFFESLEKPLKVDRHDIAMDYVVTPKKVYIFPADFADDADVFSPR